MSRPPRPPSFGSSKTLFSIEVLAKSRVCHPERSEGSRFFGRKLPQNDRNLEAFARGSIINKFSFEIFQFVQDDKDRFGNDFGETW
jgi:hypothetical protein